MTSDDLDPGLEGVTVAETRLSRIDGDAGELTIAGFPVAELAANATFEETVFLLLNDRLPTSTELTHFSSALADSRQITPELRAVIERAATEERHPMDALRMGVATANLGDEDASDRDLARRIIAVIPTIVATYWRYREGAEPVEPRTDLSHAANYLRMLTGVEPAEAAVRGLETYLSTVVDHGLNASTFTARVTVSTESDLVSAATAAVGTLKGPLHGGAPGPVLAMLREVHESGDPEGYVERTLESGERLMGFGHRVYRVRDPRAAVLESAAERFYSTQGDRAFFRTVREFEDVAVAQLAEYKPDRRLETNVEFYTATLLDGVGIPKPLFTPTFAVGRVAGWMAHALEQLDDNRLIRPRSEYVGATGRTWIPLEHRSGD